ncbi:MAG: hypothetical protein JST28_21685 [Acidobacteria bacterium]|nr:hypothetical protein [Acidobacteriota bacterium]
MNTDRRAILALIAMGRITPAEAERLLAAWNESRETAWILVASLGFALLTQLHMHELLPIFRHVIGTQLPALANMMGPVIGWMGGWL